MGTPEAGVLTETFEAERRGLFAHAYRMLGGYHEAEDVVQDTYVRALRGWETFERRSSVRTWLYRIATNVCLTAIEGRGRRALTSDVSPDDLGHPWVEPFPTDPLDLVTAREGVRLAFVAGLQHLAPRQRAVLLLREVLAFSAAETGAALDMSVPAVKSALQRARTRLAEAAPTRDDVLDATSPRARDLLARYMAAWEASDAAAFREVLRADAAIEPVGSPTSYVGREACLAFATPAMGAAGDWRMVATEANAQPAVVAWFRGDLFGVAVLTVTEGGIAAITLFGDPQAAEGFTAA
ncbi:RNA polymerase subunit sigma-70 [Micromonospora sp. WMMD964]|uniref:RNA polymerase subunit sigma-70 n=1 Tax=Micromonospora sp. WMMD964 TaxID=3016091 RepID=UPI00249C12BD|nr:RNA polymerase subunit sigma-70 [Micromonospora sp. WMMD964]WFE99298.1 RNA polymerase subunit sigma-70 [Micromonospora sp. WMMD964]